MKIRLATGDGHLANEADVPPFRSMPDVMVWGIRHFVLDRSTENYDIPVYREVFAYHVVDYLQAPATQPVDATTP